MLTPQEQAELQQLTAQYGAYTPQPEPMGLGKRVLTQGFNVIPRAMGHLFKGIDPIFNAVTLNQNSPFASTPDVEQTLPQVPEATGFGDKAVDFTLGRVAPQIAALAVPFAGGMRAATALGAGARLAMTAGDIAAGTIQAGATGDPWAIPEFAAFGGLRNLPLAARLAGGYGLSTGAQALHGDNPFTAQGQARALTDTVFAGIDAGPERSLRRDIPVEAQAPIRPALPGPEGVQPVVMREGTAPAFTGTPRPVREPLALPEANAMRQAEAQVVSPRPETPVAKTEVLPPENILAEAPSEAVDWSGNLRAKIEAHKKAGGFIDPKIIGDMADSVANAGKSVWKAGMDFATWSRDMIREFGDGVRQFLQDGWNKLTKGVDLDYVNKLYRTLTSEDTSSGKRAAANIIDSFRDVPNPVREALSRRTGVIGTTLEDFEAAFKGAPDWVAKMTPEMREIGMRYAKGEMDEAAFMADPRFTPEMRNALKQGKQITANLQDQLYQGESDPRHRALLRATAGDHVSRSFDIFVNPEKWVKDDAAFKAVVGEWASRYGGDQEVGERLLSNYLYEAKQSDAKRGIFGQSKDVKISQNIYRHRMLTEAEKAAQMREIGDDLRLEQSKATPDNAVITRLQDELKEIGDAPVLTDNMRKLLGERTNPVEAQARTIAKLTNAAANSNAIKAFDELDLDGMKAAMTNEEFGIAKRGAPDSKILDSYTPLPDTASYGKLAGKLVHPDIRRGMENFVKAQDSFADAIDRSVIGAINSQIKQNLTVRNPGTSARNYLTVPFFLLAARNFNPRDWAAALGEIRSKGGYYREALQNGILSADQVTGEFIRNIEDSLSVKPANTMLKPFKNADDFAKKVYRQPDRFVRYTTYRNARERGMSPSQAIRFTDRYTHNYGNVPRGVKTLRNLPFINPFISYNAEMFRVIKNLAQDVANKDLPMSERMTSAGILVGLTTAPLAIKEGVESTLPEKDKEEWNRMMRMSPDMQRSQLRIPLGKDEKGNFNYINADPFNIAGDYTKTIRNLLKGDFEAIIADNPVAGFRSTPLLNVAAELASGKELFSGQPIPKGPKGVVETVVRNAAPPLAGGYAGQELKKSFTPNAQGGLGITETRTGRTYSPQRFLPSLVGVRIAQQNPQTVLKSALLEAREEQESATRDLRKILQSNRAQAAKEAAVRDFNEKVKAVNQEQERRLRR